jgi:hypothetical protein
MTSDQNTRSIDCYSLGYAQHLFLAHCAAVALCSYVLLCVRLAVITMNNKRTRLTDYSFESLVFSNKTDEITVAVQYCHHLKAVADWPH